MPVPATPSSWSGSLLWLVGVFVAAFGVSWLVANRFRAQRALYVGVLAVLTAGLTAGYVAWLGVSGIDLLTSRWAWGLLAAPLSGAFMTFGMTKLPVTHRLRGRGLAAALLWDGVVYGVGEGLLLSALPSFITWQMVHSLEWSGTGGGIARWILPIVASAGVIVIHHLGYAEYRNHMLIPITAGCTMLSIGYLITASPIAPALGHVMGHTTAVLHGAELPPPQHPVTPPVARKTTQLVHSSQEVS